MSRIRPLLTTLALVLVAMLLTAAPLGAKPNKVDVCHLDGNGTYRLITIAEPAVDSHLSNHGDALPGDDHPDPGYVFGDDCTAVEDPNGDNTSGEDSIGDGDVGTVDPGF